MRGHLATMWLVVIVGCRSAAPVTMLPISPNLPKPSLQLVAYTEPVAAAPMPLTAVECVARATTAGRLDGQSIELLVTERNLSALQTGADKAELALRVKLLDLANAAEKGYWQWYGAVAVERHRTEAVQLAEELRERSRALLEPGLITRQDFARIEAAAVTQREQLLEVQHQRQQAESRLAEILGLDAAAPFAFTPAEHPLDPTIWPADESVAVALQQRPELRGAYEEYRSTPTKGKFGHRNAIASLKSEKAWLTVHDLEEHVKRTTRDAHSNTMMAMTAKRLRAEATATIARRVEAIAEKAKNATFGNKGELLEARLERTEAEALGVQAAVTLRLAVADLRRQRGEILVSYP